MENFPVRETVGSPLVKDLSIKLSLVLGNGAHYASWLSNAAAPHFVQSVSVFNITAIMR